MEQFHIYCWQPDLLQHDCILQKLGDWHQATQKLKTWITQLAAADSRAGKSCFNQCFSQTSLKAFDKSQELSQEIGMGT